MKLIPRSLFHDQQLAKSKSFTAKPKQKKHFQIPLQKCHSFKFQTAESYFQPIKNIHEENFIKNGYVSDLGPNYPEHPSRTHKRDKHKHKSHSAGKKGGEYQGHCQNTVQLQYPQPVLAKSSTTNSANNGKPNGIVYADLDMPKPSKKASMPDGTSSLSRSQRPKPKTEYATLKFNDVGHEIDV